MATHQLTPLHTHTCVNSKQIQFCDRPSGKIKIRFFIVSEIERVLVLNYLATCTILSLGNTKKRQTLRTDGLSFRITVEHSEAFFMRFKQRHDAEKKKKKNGCTWQNNDLDLALDWCACPRWSRVDSRVTKREVPKKKKRVQLRFFLVVFKVRVLGRLS